MAFYDQSLLLSSAQAITTATVASTNIYDVTGAGSGNAPALVWGNTATFGADIGAGTGGERPQAFFTVGTAFTTSSAATLSVAVQAAPDNGSNAPGTWTTLTQSAAYLVASLTAGTQILLPIPECPTSLGLPRFYRFDYIVGVGTFTAGTITGGILLDTPEAAGGIKYPANYTVV